MTTAIQSPNGDGTPAGPRPSWQDDARIANGGERCIPHLDTPWSVEHLHRYAVARTLCQGKRVLDIASGEGYGSALLAAVAADVIGIDVSADAVAHAGRKYARPNLRFKVGKAEQIPVDSASVDVAVSFETLEHLAAQEEMLSELARTLRPGGLLVISTPDRRHYPDARIHLESPELKNPFHVKELDLNEFRELVGRHFPNQRMYGQRLICGSVLVPETTPSGYVGFDGDFQVVRQTDGLATPIFHLCLASAGDLPDLPVSFCDGWEGLLGNAWGQLRGYGKSPSYRIGRALTWPLRAFKYRNWSGE